MSAAPVPLGIGAARLGAVVVALALALAGCGDDEADDPGAGRSGSAAASSPSPSSPSSPGTTASTASPAPASDVVEGTYDVGGHSLYLRCEGSGSPTVVYLHGSIKDPSFVAHSSAAGFSRLLSPDFRTCTYDRRNVVASDTVDAPQLPEDALRDLHRLLGAAEVAPPYVLVGASFGGMLAYLYANEHPRDVVGMVLLDAMFPDELSLESLFPPEERYEAFDQEDEQYSLERISHYKCIVAGQRFIGEEPDIPVTYLASTQEGYELDYPDNEEYTRRILEIQRAYAERWSPGTYERVDAPHFMEPAIPERIADEVRAVIAAAG